MLQGETRAIRDGVVAVWHPDATLELLKQAYDGPINVIDPDEAAALLDQLNQARMRPGQKPAEK